MSSRTPSPGHHHPPPPHHDPGGVVSEYIIKVAQVLWPTVSVTIS